MAERHGNAVIFEGWDGGEFGILDPGRAGRADQQMWTGADLMVYRTGLIGPRPGRQSITVTSMPTGIVVGVSQFLPSSGSGPAIWVILDKGSGTFNVVNIDLTDDTVSSTYTGTLPNITNDVHPGGGYLAGSYVNLTGHGVYQLASTTTTVSLVDTDPQGDVIGYYGERLIANTSSRLWYSEPLDWSNFGANNYVDLFSGLPHSMYVPFRDGLLLGSSAGRFGIVTGVLGATTTFRELSSGGGPASPWHGAKVADDKIWYFNGTDQFPSVFNGAVHERYEYLEVGQPRDVWTSGVPSWRLWAAEWSGVNDWIAMNDTTNGIQKMNDVMSFVDMQPDFSVPVADSILTVDNPATTAGTATFSWYTPGAHDRPAFESDDVAASDDLGVALEPTLTTPLWVDNEGHEVRVQQVLIDYEAYDCGITTDPSCVVTVLAWPRWDNSGIKESTPVTVSPMTYTAAGTSGTTGRMVVSVGDQGYAGGFQIELSEMTGLAIQRIIAVLGAETRRA